MAKKKKANVKVSKKEKERVAMNVYKKAMEEIKENVGNTTTNGTELEREGVKLFGMKFKGVYASDKIPHLDNLKSYAILNLDKSNEPGSHWIAIAHKDNTTYCYDSFGRGYKTIIKNLNYSANGRIVNTDLDAEQHPTELNCGLRCLSFLYVFHHYGAEVALLI